MSKPAPRAIVTRVRKNERQLRNALDEQEKNLAPGESIDAEAVLAHSAAVALLADFEEWENPASSE